MAKLEKYQSYKTNEVAIRQTQLENLITQPAYTTAQETVNTLMDAEGAWMTKTGIRSIDKDGKIQYYNPNQTNLFNRNSYMRKSQPGNFFNYYDPDIKDSKYQQLRLNYEKADELFMDAPLGSPNHDLLQQNSIEAERKLDDYCIEKDYNQDWGF